MTDAQEDESFESWWNYTFRLGGENIPVCRQLLPDGGNPLDFKASFKVAFKAGSARAENTMSVSDKMDHQENQEIDFLCNNGQMTLQDIINRAKEILDAFVPKEFHAVATFEIDSGYDSYSTEYVRWTRPETEQERANRLALDARTEANRLARDTAEFERLKARLGK